MINVFPWLRHLPGDMFGAKRYIQCHHDLDAMFSDPFIMQKTKEYEEGGDALDNFISAYVHERRRKEQNGETTSMDGGHLRRLLGNLFIAGSETTATTMLWFMLYMLHYPHIQEKIFAELEEKVGYNRRPTMQDKPRLPYLNAVIMETQRRASIAPFSLSRLCTADVTLQGYVIPRGTRVVTNLDSVLLDEVTWGDPFNFRPERFLDQYGGLLHPEEFVPFSMGRRVCLGESLAKMELFLFLAALVQRFRLLPSESGQPPPQRAQFGVTCPPEPFKLKFIERVDKS
ncbi:cytochrome P450 2U1 [Elysia marginata]|uniref:Cytochrome P450 2U1 n=1 Tax=Elysia marginata TaxID=1093978 RepID=A0AAV4F6S0_9GAST|nr:cytochrome P450 2U1 [Elysia marginata]